MGFFARRTEIFRLFFKLPLKVAPSPRSEKTPGTEFQDTSISYTFFNFFSHPSTRCPFGANSLELAPLFLRATEGIVRCQSADKHENPRKLAKKGSEAENSSP